MNITKMKTACIWLLIMWSLGTTGVAVSLLSSAQNASDKQRVAKYPHVEYRDFVKIGKEIQQGLNANPTTPKQYFALLEQWDKLDLSKQRDEALGFPRIRHPLIPDTTYPNLGQLLNDLLLVSDKISRASTDAEWKAAQQEYDQAPTSGLRWRGPSADFGPAMWWFLVFYIGGGLITMALRCIRAAERNAYGLVEIFRLATWRDGFAWLYYCWRNPNVTLQEQLSTIRRAITSVFVGALSLAGAGAGKVCGQDKPKDKDGGSSDKTIVVDQSNRLSFRWQIGVEPNYIGRFVGRNFHPGGVVTNSVTATDTRTGLFVNFWASKAFDNRQYKFGDEVDLGVGWAKKMRGLNVGLDFNAISARPLSKWPQGDVGVASLKVGKTLKLAARYSVEPVGFARYSTPLKHGGPGRGWIFEGGANHSLDLRKWLNLSGTTTVVGHTGPYGFPSGAHVYADYGLNWKHGHLTISAPSGKVTRPITRSGDGQHPLANIGASIALDW